MMRQAGRIFGKKRKGVTALEISPDGARLIVGLRDETARLVDPRSRRILHTLSGHRGEVGDVSFSPDGAVVATGEKTLHGELVPSSVTAFAIARRRDLMVIAYFWRTDPMEVGESIASKLALYDLTSGSVRAELDGGDFAYNDLVFAPDEKTMVAGCSDGLIGLIDLGSRTTVRTLEGHPGQVTSVAAHPDGTMVVSGDSGGQVLFWRDD
ncbi:MAG: hypothetical protein KAI47_07050 [Deltaproteobacteria bacterium]|nr:hypothetical protein [Deltaproteobacteria bacterium]